MSNFLRIYLNDQLAMGIAWRELAKRACRANRGTPLGEALARVETGIREDVETYKTIMHRVGVPPNPIKKTLALGVERLSRLKFNGRLRSYSPLSRFEELEALVMGIEGKKQLWATLRDLGRLGSRLPDVDFDELIARADRQSRELEPFRVSVGTDVLGGTSSPSPSPSIPAARERVRGVSRV